MKRARRHPAAARPVPPPQPALDAAAESQALADAAAQLDVTLDATQRQRLLAYLALLRRWNAVYNLTAIRDPAEMRVHHLFDCLAIVPPLRAAPPDGADLLRDGAVVLDVGSGGGLPGVVIAVCAPGAQVHCVDAVGKKAAFVTQVRAELGLDNLHAHHARVESLQVPRDLPAPTLAVSRAFATLARFVALTEPLLSRGGRWAAMKATMPDDELAALPASVRLAAEITLAVPQLAAQRRLLLLERIAR